MEHDGEVVPANMCMCNFAMTDFFDTMQLTASLCYSLYVTRGYKQHEYDRIVFASITTIRYEVRQTSNHRIFLKIKPYSAFCSRWLRKKRLCIQLRIDKTDTYRMDRQNDEKVESNTCVCVCMYVCD